METVKIKPSHESQGEFVIINKDDFNPEIHELFGDATEAPKVKTTKQTKGAE
jgi:hypothetical protein